MFFSSYCKGLSLFYDEQRFLEVLILERWAYAREALLANKPKHRYSNNRKMAAGK